jgi:hypothetical protein
MKRTAPVLATDAPEKDRDPARFHLLSHLDLSYRDELDQLFFFNPRQSKVKDQVLHSIARYGSPEIQAVGQKITLGIRNIQGAQALFILAGKKKLLQGVLVYIRENDRLVVLYLALNPACTANWQSSCASLVCITQALRSIALQISGINFVELAVGAKRIQMRIH